MHIDLLQPTNRYGEKIMKTSRIISIAIIALGLGTISCNIPVHFSNMKTENTDAQQANAEVKGQLHTGPSNVAVFKPVATPKTGHAVKKPIAVKDSACVSKNTPVKKNAVTQSKKVKSHLRNSSQDKKMRVAVSGKEKKVPDLDEQWHLVTEAISNWPYIRLVGFLGMIIVSILFLFVSQRLINSSHKTKKQK
jgi:hypothetical protein